MSEQASSHAAAMRPRAARPAERPGAPVAELAATIFPILKLAEALFGEAEADLLTLDGARLRRARHGRPIVGDALARRLAQIDRPLWVESLSTDRQWADRARSRDAFCVATPVSGVGARRLGVLLVVGQPRRARDPKLLESLQHLSAVLADRYDNLLSGDLHRARELFESAPGFMAISRGPDHVIEMVNKAFRRYVGERRDVVGRPAAEALPELVPQGCKALLDDVYRTGRTHSGRGERLFLRRGPPDAPPEEVFVDYVFQPIREPDGTVSGIFCQGHEVTEIRSAELALSASQRELETSASATRAILDQLRDVVCTLDADGRFTDVSRRAEAIWGEAPEAMIGRNHLDVIHPDDRAAAAAAMELIRAGAPASSFLARAMHRDGGEVSVMWSSVWSAEHGRFFAVGRDMREHLRSEELQRQARKMEAVGRLTGGVAHDFNNLLTTMIGSCELLLQGLEADDPRRPHAELISEACERGIDLVGSLLAFSRKQALRPEGLSCEAVLRSLLAIVRSSLPESIKVEIETPAPDLWCLADRSGLTTALLNLCINARDAMPDGGELRILVRQSDADGGLDGAIVFEVRDNGCGMPPDILERALEPFFTTKPPGKGTGLGLSTVHGFATQSGGRLEIRSRPGGGTSVLLTLPAAAPGVLVLPGVPFPSLPVGAAKRILVVEDDHLVREQLNRQLLASGYRVELAANGPEALAILAGGTIDLLLTDVIMPGGMNGRQLADQARLMKPELPIVFTSGYLDDAILREARLEKGVRLLRKPYRRNELMAIVEEAFSEPMEPFAHPAAGDQDQTGHQGGRG